MTPSEIGESRLVAGVWTVSLPGRATAPSGIEVWHGGEALGPVTVAPLAGGDGWSVSVRVPPQVLSDGAHALVLTEDGRFLAHLGLAAGTATDADLRAEVALLRAELDLLKQAVRRLARDISG